jgi:hypothetical protein
VLGSAASCADDDFVDRLTVINGTPFDIDVQLSDADKNGWRPLGQATHESSTVTQAVRDAGPTWVFRFHREGRTVGELSIDREELRRARWRVEVPSSVAIRMRNLGFEPASED